MGHAVLVFSVLGLLLGLGVTAVMLPHCGWHHGCFHHYCGSLGWSDLSAVLLTGGLGGLPLGLGVGLGVGAVWRGVGGRATWTALGTGAALGALVASTLAYDDHLVAAAFGALCGTPLSSVLQALTRASRAGRQPERHRHARTVPGARARALRSLADDADDVARPERGLSWIDAGVAAACGTAVAMLGVVVLQGSLGEDGVRELLSACLPFTPGPVQLRVMLAGSCLAAGTLGVAALLALRPPAVALGRLQGALVGLSGYACSVLAVPAAVLLFD